MNKIKIVSNGNGADILDADTGESIAKALRCTHIEIDATNPTPKAILMVESPALDLVCDVWIEHSQTIEYDPTDIDSIDHVIAHLQAQRAERLTQ